MKFKDKDELVSIGAIRVKTKKMNEQEFGFETQAIRTQLERTQYLEHRVRMMQKWADYLDALRQQG